LAALFLAATFFAERSEERQRMFENRCIERPSDDRRFCGRASATAAKLPL